MAASATMFAVDVGPSMAAAFETVRQLVSRLALGRIHSTGAPSRELLGLATFASDRTNHATFSAEGTFEHVEVLHPCRGLDVELLRVIDRDLRLNRDGMVLDFFPALVVVMREIVEAVQKRKLTKRCVLITDAAIAVTLDDEQDLIKVVGYAMREGFRIDVVCVNYPSERDMESVSLDDVPSDIRGNSDFLKEFLDGSGPSFTQEVELRRRLLNRRGKRTTSVQLFNQTLLRRITALTNGRICCLEAAYEETQAFPRKFIKSIHKFRGALQVSSNLSIPVEVYGKVVPTVLSSPTKLSWNQTKLSRAEGGDDVPARVERANLSTDADEELKLEDVMKGYYYGSDLIPASSLEEAELRFVSQDKLLKALGFVSHSVIPRHFLAGAVDVVVALPGSQPAWFALTSLTGAMLSSGTSMVASYVQRPGQGFQLVELWPYRDNQGSFRLYMARLPTSEDIRSLILKPLQTISDSLLNTEKDLMGRFVRMLNFPESAKPSKVFNPVLQYFREVIVQRALDGGDSGDLPLPSSAVLDVVNPQGQAVDQKDFIQTIEDLRQSMATSKVTKIASAKRAVGEGIALRESVAKQLKNGEPELERLKVDKGLLDSVEAGEEILMIGDINPAVDFEKMLSTGRECDVEFAFGQIMTKIMSLIHASHDGEYFPRAVSALEALRLGSVKYERSSDFNEFLSTLVGRAESGHSPGTQSNFKDFLRRVNSVNPELTYPVNPPGDASLNLQRRIQSILGHQSRPSTPALEACSFQDISDDDF